MISLKKQFFLAVCSEYNHVRSWGVTRFRGMISTQPGSTSLASFKVLTLDSTDDTIDGDSTDPGDLFISSFISPFRISDDGFLDA
uniref:Uncharacterized protein n=1 Tax=Parascaris equorum TaxID=6256 RepID=A0A914S6P9_PAREQ